jgi:hypothetical protein
MFSTVDGVEAMIVNPAVSLLLMNNRRGWNRVVGSLNSLGINFDLSSAVLKLSC